MYRILKTFKNSQKQNTFVDRKFLREDFFKEMRMLFLYVAKKISNGDQLPHWELLMNEYPKITPENAAVDESVERKVNSIISTKVSENELIAEADAPLERAHPVTGKAAKICKSRSKQRCDYFNSVGNRFQGKSVSFRT